MVWAMSYDIREMKIVKIAALTDLNLFYDILHSVFTCRIFYYVMFSG